LLGCLAMAAFTHRRKRLSEENTDHL
jgi:hypothetical protein